MEVGVFSLLSEVGSDSDSLEFHMDDLMIWAGSGDASTGYMSAPGTPPAGEKNLDGGASAALLCSSGRYGNATGLAAATSSASSPSPAAGSGGWWSSGMASSSRDMCAATLVAALRRLPTRRHCNLAPKGHDYAQRAESFSFCFSYMLLFLLPLVSLRLRLRLSLGLGLGLGLGLCLRLGLGLGLRLSLRLRLRLRLRLCQ